jgi:inositol 1,4,5-triphosphate receptor type 1/inositol 1,4,5-triphosphate receptor type 3
MQNRFDEEIVFGAAVIFRHVDSEQYLQGSYECSEFATDAYKLQLAAHLSSLVTFKLMPYQTFQQEGHPIYIDEPLMIVHEKSKCKVDFVKSKRVFVDEEIVFAFNDQEIEIDMHAYEQFRPNIRKPRADTKRFEAVINHGGENFWVLKLHETFEQSREKICIKPFDLCVFQYTENRGYLSVDSNGLKIILKEMFEPESAGIPLDAVWEL